MKFCSSIVTAMLAAVSIASPMPQSKSEKNHQEETSTEIVDGTSNVHHWYDPEKYISAEKQKEIFEVLKKDGKWIASKAAEGTIVTGAGLAITEIVRKLQNRDLEAVNETDSSTENHYWFLPKSWLEPEIREELVDGLKYISKDLLSGGLYVVGSKTAEAAWKAVTHSSKRDEIETESGLQPEFKPEPVVRQQSSSEEKSVKEVHHWYYPSEYISKDTIDMLETDGKFIAKGLTDGFLQSLGGKIGNTAWNIVLAPEEKQNSD